MKTTLWRSSGLAIEQSAEREQSQKEKNDDLRMIELGGRTGLFCLGVSITLSTLTHGKNKEAGARKPKKKKLSLVRFVTFFIH